FDEGRDIEAGDPVVGLQRCFQRVFLARRSTHHDGEQDAVRILDQALPLQGETVGDHHAADLDQQALPSFRQGLDFQLDHQAPLCALLVYQVVRDSMPGRNCAKREAPGTSAIIQALTCPQGGVTHEIAFAGRPGLLLAMRAAYAAPVAALAVHSPRHDMAHGLTRGLSAAMLALSLPLFAQVASVSGAVSNQVSVAGIHADMALDATDLGTV